MLKSYGTEQERNRAASIQRMIGIHGIVIHVVLEQKLLMAVRFLYAEQLELMHESFQAFTILISMMHRFTTINVQIDLLIMYRGGYSRRRRSFWH